MNFHSQASFCQYWRLVIDILHLLCILPQIHVWINANADVTANTVYRCHPWVRTKLVIEWGMICIEMYCL